MLKNALGKVIDRRSKPYIYFYHNWYKRSKFPSVDHIIDRFAALKKEVFFVQIGTNDGATSDPFYRHIRLRNWKGILVEPLRFEFEELKKNHLNNDNLIFENVAISNKRETKKFYTIDKSEGDLPFWVTKLSSFDPKVPQEICDLYDNARMVEIDVECCTIHDLLEKHNIDHPNLILTDTEGFDFEILKTIDFERIRPEMLIYEHAHLSEEDYEASLKMLRPHGYNIFKDENDTIAFISEQLRTEYIKYLI